MKKLLNVFILSAICAFSVSCATSRVPADFSGVNCGDAVFEYQENGTVKLSFCVEVPADYFETRITFRIMPAIRYANGDVQELPCKTVQGVSVVDTNYPVIDWTVDQTICYTYTIPYHEGLATAVLETRGWVYNCLTKEEMTNSLCSWDVIVPLAPVNPIYAPNVATESDIRAALRGKIYFPVNGYTVTNTIANQPEITRTLGQLNQLIQREDFQITEIEITGNASPEGTSRINDPLAKKRADNTKTFFEKALKQQGYTKEVPEGSWTVKSTSGLGFWNEFYTAIMESEIPNKEVVASRFLKLSNDPAEAETQIRQEMNANKDVKNLMMPSLRYGAIVVSFNPIQLSPEEILSIANNQPEYLTPNDIIGAAESMCPKDAIPLYKRAIERYPGAVELYINLANAYITTGEYDAAEQTLANAAVVADEQDEKDMIAIQQGCIYIKRGMFDKAAEQYAKVSDAEKTKYYRGVLAIYAGNNEEAIDLLADAKDINYAVALLNVNRVKDALNVLKGLDQEDGYVVYCTGICYSRLNEVTKAKECFEKASQLGFDPSLNYSPLAGGHCGGDKNVAKQHGEGHCK